MPRIRFHLRTLLLVTIALGCGLGWWFRPYTIEEHWPGGQLKSQLHVRRRWNGEVITNGQQSWWWSNGQLARRGMSHGCEIDELGIGGSRVSYVTFILLSQESTYNDQGEPSDLKQLDFFLLWWRMEEQNVEQWPADRFPETPHE